VWIDGNVTGQLDDEEQSSWPSSSSQIDDHCAEMDALIKENREITLSVVALNVAIMYGSAFVIVRDVLSYHKVRAGWVSLADRGTQTDLFMHV
jgi:hypothetical protein